MAKIAAALLTVLLLSPVAEARQRGTLLTLGATVLDEQESEDSEHPQAEERRTPRRMTESEMQGAGCAVSALAATGLTYALNPTELALVITGGTMPPTTPAVLFMAVTGTITMAACGMGAIMTPTVVWAYQESDAIGRAVADRWASLFATAGHREPEHHQKHEKPGD